LDVAGAQIKLGFGLGLQWVYRVMMLLGLGCPNELGPSPFLILFFTGFPKMALAFLHSFSGPGPVFLFVSFAALILHSFRVSLVLHFRIFLLSVFLFISL
jgi:hypothetical protein